MDTDDEAYESGLSLPSVSDQFKEDVKQNDPGAARKGGDGSNPLAENPPKEPPSLNIGDSLLGKGKLRGAPKADSSSIKAAPAINPETFAMTPTTHLAGQFGSISFLSQKPTLEGKHPSLSDSPTSEYASGNFPSLAESGYDSLHSITSVEKPDQAVAALGGPIMVEKPVLIAGPGSGEEMDIDHVSLRPPKVSIANAATIFNSKAADIDSDDVPKIDTEDVSFLPISAGKGRTGSTGSTGSWESSSLSPASLTMLPVGVRSESPGIVPAIAEDIEIVTDAMSPPTSERRHEGVSSKRSAMGHLESDFGPTTKNPRLSPESQSKYV